MTKTIRAVVLNVERHVHRLISFQEQASKIGLRVERLAAIDAATEEGRSFIRARALGSPLSMGELACMMGHVMAWEILLESSETHLAVFEDDAHLADDLPGLLQLEEIPMDVGLIKLEAYRDRVAISRKPLATLGWRRLHKLLGRSYGSAGYIISRQCAAWLIEEARKYAEPVDHVLFGHEAEVKKRFSVLQVVPAACVQDDCLARMQGGTVRHASTLERSARQLKERKRPDGKGRIFKKITRYTRWVAQGANPFRCRVLIDVVLKSPVLGKKAV